MPASPHDTQRPRAWRGADEARSNAWIVQLDARERAELNAAAEKIRASGKTLDGVTRADFDLPRVAAKLAAVRWELQWGGGFVLLRGLSVGDYSEDELGAIFWGIGAYLGVGVSQSQQGDRLGHVIDRGGKAGERYYNVGGPLEFHMDPVDVVGLLCLRRALEGGASRIVSALAVHDAIRAERPELLEILYRGFHCSRRGHGEAGAPRVPVFAQGGSGIECYFLPITVRQAAEEGFPLSPLEQETLYFIAEVANRPELRLDMDFQEGDMQFLNNRVILHARTDYKDDPNPALKRHLLRLWLMMPDWPPRAAAMSFHDQVDRAGGGVRVE